ncbi:biotin carboxylase [Monoraphidium neglectum]|uniref:Biotin carboxylase n=1 Tax=Monoraphidium neglectum TaxID=145388 RepID=A0A0D2J1J3_9CHLO|nr:biotin carboxylase [Monoraphidium neglectum]KIY93907.1 biotin carboxylase [Monoraphidium neglectum]|eukprot:XP_013892927.1 biotin carboxylase [Monoraphidium neglectum]
MAAAHPLPPHAPTPPAARRGHASENPELPTALAARGIRFLGPPAAAMAALGDKIGSTILAQAAGVPTLPWSGSGVAISYEDCGGEIPLDIYNKACVFSLEEAIESCNRIGYPIMLKASWGGGGKGIRKVQGDEDVRAVFKQIQGEVPGSPIFAMKLAPLSRHLEVQLLADRHGNVVSLFTRDCSVQRRHQKIVEEGPALAASQEMLRDMERCARALARSVGYQGAATVEYLYSIEEKKYYFLELNPRLQVEHPVTEGITNVNIPSVQLLIGMGVPLWRIPQVRATFQGVEARLEVEQFDMEATPQRLPDSHVVAVRITSENANNGFKPTAGRIDELMFKPTPEVWGYFSVKSGGGIHEFSDSQFGHLFAKGETREAAIRAMVVALRDVRVRGEIHTIIDYAVDMLTSPDFVQNRIHTGWLDARIAANVKAERPPWHLCVIGSAVVGTFPPPPLHP